VPLAKGEYRYAMALLIGISVVNYIDRQVINIVAEPIKRELHLADWQIGVLTGLAFGVLYTFLGLPIARLAERSHRPRIIATAAALWSVFTVASGLVRNYGQLALARVGVGLGEAGCVPPSHSLIMDYAPREKRNSAMALFGMSPQLGVVIGLASGGLVADAYGWRAAFLLAGGPGLILAVIAAFTLPEPRLGLRDPGAPTTATAPSIFALFRLVRPKRTYWLLGAGITLNVFIALASGPFIASFFLRNHPQELAKMAGAAGTLLGVRLGSVGLLGLILGGVLGIDGALGSWCGGLIADRMGLADPRRHLQVPAVAILLWAPVFLGVLTAPSLGLAFMLLGVQGFLAAVYYGPTFAAWLSLTPPNMRATNSALILFSSNLIGLGLGPAFIGLLSDHYAKTMGSAEGLRWALTSLAGASVVDALLFWLASKSVVQDREG
jgi:MFS family permease